MLEKARHGLYAKSLVGAVSPQRLQRFFVEADGGYRVSKTLRDMVVFARQNLTSDPPFSRVDLISCRNLLIYLQPSAQKKAMPTFHYALTPGGFLLLGASESIGEFTDLFEVADKKHKIYSRKPARTSGLHLPARTQHAEEPSGPVLIPQGLKQELPEASRGELNAQREADRIIVNNFAPAGVLVDADLHVLQFRGATGAFLEPPSGNPSFDVLKMARQGLMLPLRRAIIQAKKENKAARKENIHLKHNGETRAVNLEVIPLKNLRERCFLILFEEAGKASDRHEPSPPRRTRADRSPHAETESRIAELETELAETRDYLQSVREQLETSNEEFQASNEEVQSANEELQSGNEELETSKEELESTNEELTTVNEEMSNRNVELNRLNNDLVNLQAAANVGIVLLGRDLSIRRFSPHAEKQFDLRAADVGRPIGHIRHDLVLGDATQSPLDLEGLCAEVIDGRREQELEVRDRSGRWYSLRVRSYMTFDNKVDGAVLVVVDINTLKRSEQAVRESEAELSTADRHKDEFLATLGHELRNPLSALMLGLERMGAVPDDRARSEELRGMMVRQATRMGSLLDELLDLARVTSGKIELSMHCIDLADVVRGAAETVMPLVESQKHKLTLSLPPDKSALVLGDGVRLTQVVENLLTNAAKYTNAGGQIALTLTLDKDQARIFVRDTGAGISAEFLPHVFEVFTQAPQTLDRSKGGLGLGLPLVKRLVEMHQGQVTASSPGPGQGSEFTVTLPRLLSKRSKERIDSQRVPSGPGKILPRRILVVDDEEDTAAIFAELLEEEGHQTLAVGNGPAALAAIRTFAPEVVLVDLGLPVMDGYEIAKRIREEHGDKKILLIAVTGYQKDAARLKQAGFDQHLIKPPDMLKLSAFIAGWDPTTGQGMHRRDASDGVDVPKVPTGSELPRRST